MSIEVQAVSSKQDSGTVTLSVNTGSGYAVASSATYSAGSTPSSVAAGLASGLVAGAPVSVSAVDDQITIASTATGSAVNYPFLIETSTWDSTDFSQPSFANPAISGTLDGGQAASSSQTPQPVYSFTIPASGGYDASGNILSYTDSVMGTWSYSYDTLNRLSTGSQTAAGSQALSSLPNLCWNYDAFGNRLQQYGASAAFESGSGGPNACQPQSSATVSTALASFDQNNRMTSTNERGVTAQVLYDASGNVTWDGVNYYLYDAESRICAVASTAAGTPIMTGYMYDADGIRVSKGTIQQWSCNPTTAQYATQTDYILGPGGEQMSEYAMQPSNTMAWVHTNVWAAGRLLATYAQDSSSTTQKGLIHFYFNDPLGSRRAQTDYAGNLEQDCGNLPYGDGETCAPTPTEHLFTNKERDAESGNDYFGARYYASAMGRFLSPDWSAKVEPVPYSKLDDPQTLNLYAYVLNNPVARGDIDGHVPLSWGGFEDCGERNDCSDNVEEKLQAGMDNQANVEANKVFDARDQKKAQQQNPNQVVGNTTEGSLAKVLTNEDGSLSTKKGGDPQELVDGKTSLANAIYNNANLDHPEKVAPATGTASAQDSQIMQGVVTSRTNGGADPVQGRHYYGTSHSANLKSRSALNGLKGAAGRETVFAKFGPFHDSIAPRRDTYIYIYNDPGH